VSRRGGNDDGGSRVDKVPGFTLARGRQPYFTAEIFGAENQPADPRRARGDYRRIQ
jgi:hypothetical protein